MKYTIEDLRNGKVAVINDGTLEQLRDVLEKCKPGSTTLGIFKYYWFEKNGDIKCSNETSRESQSVKDFLTDDLNPHRFYTDYTERLHTFHSQAANKCGIKEKCAYYSNTDAAGTIGYFSGDNVPTDHSEYVSEAEFMKRMGLSDNVNRPPHYTQGGIECIEAIKSSLSEEGYKGYLKGNIEKYIWRYEHKLNTVEDLKKAQWYLERLIKEVEAKNV